MRAEAKEALGIAFDSTKLVRDRIAAARRVAVLADDEAEAVVLLAALAAHLKRSDRGELLIILGQMGALERLSADAKSPDPAVRLRSAMLLGVLEDREASPILIAALSDVEQRVREAAASALRRLRDPRALAALAAGVLDDPDPDVRGACAQALGELDEPRALEALEQATREEADVFTIILIERSILRFTQRAEGRSEEEPASGDEVRLPSSVGMRPPKRRSSSTMALSVAS
jgi:HEAT repeat protein